MGPEATIQNSAVSWPSATSASRTSLATSASLRPTSGPGDDALDGPVGGLGGGPQQRDLLGILDAAQRRQHARGQAPGPPGSSACRPSTKAARRPSETRKRGSRWSRANQRRHERERIVGLVPGDELDARRPPSPGAASAAAASSRGLM